MNNNSGFDFLRFRDGTSQQLRLAKALDPNYFAMDERSIRDLLEFSRRFASTLKFFNSNNNEEGDWSAFLEGDLNEMVAYLKNPAYFDHQPEKKARFAQPHFALFLTFLALLQQAQVQMNTITQRQLDFYYQQALGLQRRSGRPDQVHVIAELESEEDQVLIPKGSLLFAGEDPEGDPILYQTDEALLANPAKIAHALSLHVEKDIQNLFSMREFEKDTAEPQKVLLEQLKLVYRLPGTENTPRLYPANRTTDRKLNIELINNLDELYNFIEGDKSPLSLRITSFQYIMELYSAWENPLNWHREGKEVAGTLGGGINDYLTKAASSSPTFIDEKDFDENIKIALGIDINGQPVIEPQEKDINGKIKTDPTPAKNKLKNLNSDGIENIYDLYFAYLRLKNTIEITDIPKDDVYKKIIELISSPNVTNFESMMKLRMDTLGYFKEILRILGDKKPDSSDVELELEEKNNLEILQGSGDLHLFYKKGKTLASLIKYIRQLSSTDLEFPAWDKERLTITIPSDNFDITNVWDETTNKGGFSIEKIGAPTPISAPTEIVLTRKYTIELPAHQPGTFLKVIYTSSIEMPKVKIVLESSSDSVGFDFSTPGLLTINIPNETTSVKDIVNAWSDQGSFKLKQITPKLIIPVMNPGIDPEIILDKEFSFKIPDQPDNFLTIKYTGVSSNKPEVIILHDEFLTTPVGFEIRNNDLVITLIIKVKNKKTQTSEILKAWKKNTQKGQFNLAYVGTGSIVILNTDPSHPLSLNEDDSFSTLLPTSEPSNFFKVKYTGSSSDIPKVIVKEKSDSSDPNFILDNGHQLLTIQLKADHIPLINILDDWNTWKKSNPNGYDFELISSPIVIPESQIILNKEYSAQLPEGATNDYLLIKYTGLWSTPKVAVQLGGNLRLDTSHQSFTDEYFKIKGAQLAQVENYFKMQAEDFFFIQNLFKVEKDENENPNWEYRYPVWQWRRVDELLLQAHQDLLGKQAIPEIIRWKNLYIARDARQVLVPGFNDQEEFPRWKTFGKVPDPQIPGETDIIETGELGFVLTTPTLSLQEGIRTLTLTLTFEETSFDRANLETFFAELIGIDLKSALNKERFYPFTVKISTEKEWVEIAKWSKFEIAKTAPTITITLVIDEDFEPIVPIADAPFPGAHPALKLIMNREKIDVFASQSNPVLKSRRPYELLRQLMLTKVSLGVDVKKLKNIQAQNFQGSIDPLKPFEPFGLEPKVGDRFFITHPELASHRLDSFSLDLTWKNFPENGLKSHYDPYSILGSDLKIPGLPITRESFKVDIALREAHRSLEFSKNKTLFASPPTSSDKDKSFLECNSQNLKFLPNNTKYNRKIQPKMDEDVLQADRYIQIELLSPDFQHHNLSTLLTLQTMSGRLEGEIKEILKIESEAGKKFIQLKGIVAQSLDKSKFIVKETNIVVTEFDSTKNQLSLDTTEDDETEVTVTYPGQLILQDPYTPVLDSIHVNYTTSVEVALPVMERTWFVDDPAPSSNVTLSNEQKKADDQLLHLHPFGRRPVEKSGSWKKINEDKENKTITEKLFFSFLPLYEDEGQLYLGFENLNPPQTLSLLLQMAEGSGNPDLPTASVEWACLTGHDWKVLKGEQIRQDSTHGFQNTGIVELAIPAESTSKHTLMPAGFHWIRATVNRHSASLNDTIDIRPQALRATWLDQGLDAGHLGRTLPPESIEEPMSPIPGLLTFIQPYSSFHGKAKEEMSHFYQRASERLRHKKRALTMWDYERLVLERFPDIYKVKALASDLLDAGAEPGEVVVIVIPDIRFRRPFNPFEPKVPQRQLKEIQQFLQEIAPPFVRVRVQNPRFDYIHVRAAVLFTDMENFNYYADQLQRELKQFLSPWAFEEAAEITFGRNIYLSLLIHFMETRPYVDFIDQPKLILMEQLASDGTLNPVKGEQAVGPDGIVQLRAPDIILVSSPDHTIEFLDVSIDPEKRILSGIGYEKLDLDFKVRNNK